MEALLNNYDNDDDNYGKYTIINGLKLNIYPFYIFKYY